MGKRRILLPALSAATAVLAVVSVLLFTLENRRNISRNNREYLQDNTAQMAVLVEDSLAHGLASIQALSSLAGELVDSPELDVATLQRILDDSIFDFMEFADREGWNHNTTGGVTDARDRRYYLDAMAGRAGVELIFNSRATRETLLVFYAPVYYRGEMIGSLIGAYQGSRQLEHLLTMDVFGYRAEAYLCDEQGRVIASNQAVDTTAEVSIGTVLGPRLDPRGGAADLLYRGETALVPLAGNETGACVMGLENSGWYIVQVFPEQAHALMVERANRIGVSLAVFLVAILAVLLVLTYLILDRSRRDTQRALEKAEAASGAKSEFLFSMSHDIRTPMNGIIGFLRLLKEQQDQPERREEYIRKMEDSSQMLLSILNNVLEMARIEGGAGALEETAWSVEALVEDVCGLLAPKMAEKHIVFTHAAAVRHPAVWCDRAKVQEVFLNILNNACQYTPEGGTVSVRVTELPSEEDGAALYKTEITDSGIGMDETFLPHLFEAFARAQDTTHSKVSGTGLGMTIAKRLTDLMGGTIAVESAAGRGTRVTVVLPLRLAGKADLTDRPAWDAGTADLAGKRILLAEDNDLNAEIAAKLLGELGLLVERARDGDECVAMLEREEQAHYDLILMDVQMPRMSGYEAAAAIRKLGDPAKASIPIVAMTANAFAEDKQNAGAAGMDGHLAKPVDMEKLLERLREFL